LATLTREQIVTIEVLQQHGQSQRETARILGVAEGTVRYHLRRAKEAATDGRLSRDIKFDREIATPSLIAHIQTTTIGVGLRSTP
jgi:transcriptional regulator